MLVHGPASQVALRDLEVPLEQDPEETSARVAQFHGGGRKNELIGRFGRLAAAEEMGSRDGWLANAHHRGRDWMTSFCM